MPSENQNEQDSIIEYVELEANPQQIISIEKINSASTTIGNFDIWKVSTRDDWWVVAPLTNLYPLNEYPDVDSVVSAHSGIVETLTDQDDDAASLDRYDILTRNSRELLDEVDDALFEEQLNQDVESIKGHPKLVISRFVERIIEVGRFTYLENKPDDQEYDIWLLRIIDEIFSDPALQHLHKHLKTMIESTWDLVTRVDSSEKPERTSVYHASWSADELMRRLNKLIVEFEYSETS